MSRVHCRPVFNNVTREIIIAVIIDIKIQRCIVYTIVINLYNCMSVTVLRV